MTLQEIKSSTKEGKKVYWTNENYLITNPYNDEWLIVSQGNNHAIGLTHRDGTTMNGKESEFFTLDNM